jgi:hypothetical protein
MKKEPVAKRGDDMRKEYDLSKLAGGRGKYYRRATAGTNLVLIEPDLVNMFPDSEGQRRSPRVGRSRPNSERLQAPALALI